MSVSCFPTDPDSKPPTPDLFIQFREKIVSGPEKFVSRSVFYYTQTIKMAAPSINVIQLRFKKCQHEEEYSIKASLKRLNDFRVQDPNQTWHLTICKSDRECKNNFKIFF